MRMWYKIKRMVKDPGSPQVLRVQRIENRHVCEYNKKEEVEQVVQEECEVRLNLADKAPVIKHALANKLRYLEDEEIAKTIVEGTYEVPTDLDEATTYILQEIGSTGMEIQNEEEEEIIITPDDLRRFWKRVSEWTTSSTSSVHYDHYEASILHKMSSKIHAQQLTVIARSGVAPERWSISLPVLLEKITGVCLVEKLRYIQLYEADFNFFQRFIFGKQAMKTLTKNRFLPNEHFRKKESTAEDSKFDKTLTADLSCQARKPMGNVLMDAAQCYDRVNYAIMSLVWCALIKHIGPIGVLLPCLQTMRFDQRTGHGDSTSFIGGEGFYFMGLGQGSRGVPPSAVCASSVIVNILRGLHCGAHTLDLITSALVHSVGGHVC